jgi:DNA polymerase I-like protein with 3'-5' exonuclease and polymerase domains
MKRLAIDIETDGLDATEIWCAVTKDIDNGEVKVWKTASELLRYVEPEDTLIGHNIIGFDLPVLKKLWNLKTNSNPLRDTLIMSRLLNPVLEKGHSLDSWGVRLGLKKGDFSDFDGGLSDSMVEYCIQDVEITHALFTHLNSSLLGWGQSVDLEHEVATVVKKQEVNGFKLDVPKCMTMLSDWQQSLIDIEEELQQVFQPITTERYSDKTGKRLKDKVTVFNPGSRKQIAERLMSLGWKPRKHTEKGSVIVDEKVLQTVRIPQAKPILRYLLLQKRVAQVKSWVENVSERGRVHCQVRTNGAITGRMTHSKPNLAQVPRVGTEYGEECRSVWTVEDGNVLLGADASGLELRMLAHFMDDPTYTKEILSGDIHTANMKAAGLTDRDQAKTFIYAFLYGAGPAKIGAIVGGREREGKRLINSFLKNTPALQKLKDKVSRLAEKEWLPGLDGRRLIVRSQHAALNTLLQGAGAIVMKQALIMLNRKLIHANMDARFVANVHDEWQIETTEQDAETVGHFAVQSIRQAGIRLNLRCPLDGEFKVGLNWASTH